MDIYGVQRWWLTLMNNLLLSDKYKTFLKCEAPVEFLEGT